MRRRSCAPLLLLFLLAAVALLHPTSLPVLVLRARSHGIELSSTYDVTVEGVGRAGHALRLQDPHQFLASGPLFLQSAPGGVEELTVTLWYRHLLPDKFPQVLTYEIAPDHTGSNALISLYSYGFVTFNFGRVTNIVTVRGMLADEWVHVAFSWVSATGTLRVYMNGVEEWSQDGIEDGWRLPAGGVLAIGQPRYADVQFGFLVEFGLFRSAMPPADVALLVSGQGAALPPSVFLADLCARNLAELYWTFNQRTRFEFSEPTEVIADVSGNGNTAQVICVTHCRTSILVPARIPGIVLSDAATVLVPISPAGVLGEFLLYLAHLAPSSNAASAATPYAATKVTIDALPDAQVGTLYRVDPAVEGGVGAALAAGEELLPSEMNEAVRSAGFLGVVLRTNATFGRTSWSSMRYTLHPFNTSLAPFGTTLTLGANRPPTPSPPRGFLDPPYLPGPVEPPVALQSIELDEGFALSFWPQWRRYPSVDFFASDPNGDEVTVYIVGLPSTGKLYQNDTDRREGRSIDAASLDNPVRVQGQRLLYVAPMLQEDHALLLLNDDASSSWPNVTLLLSDGHQVAAQLSVIRFLVRGTPHLPVLNPLRVEVDQGALALLTLQVDRSLLHPDDAPYLTVTALPAEGALYQVNADGSVGRRIASQVTATDLASPFGSTLPSATKCPSGKSMVFNGPISQWLSRVTAWSSSYPDPEGLWNVTNILGPPDVFPMYGDNGLAWAGLYTASPEWIEAEFDWPVYISTVEVFETFQPGHVVNILAKEPVTGRWQLIWHNNAVAPPVPQQNGRSEVLSPSLCPMTFATNAIRLETASAGDSWVEIDAVRVVGYEEYNVLHSSPMAVTDPLGRVWFQAPLYTRGDLTFNVSASSCEYYSTFRSLGAEAVDGSDTTMITTSLQPINHDPMAFNVSVTTSVEGAVLMPFTQMHAVDERSAAGQILAANGPLAIDPDGDTLRFELLSLPASGRVWLVQQEQHKTLDLATNFSSDCLDDGARLYEDDLPLRVPVGAMLYFERDSACMVEDDGLFLPVEFAYAALDTSGARSATVRMQVRIYCVDVEKLPPALVRGVLGLMGIGILACIIIGAMIIGHRAQPMIAASSPLFHLIALMGVVFHYVAMLSQVIQPLTTTWCMMRWSFFSMGIGWLFAAVFAKTLRVYRIAGNKSLANRRLRDRDLLKVVAVVVLVLGLELALIRILAPLEPVFYYKDDAKHSARMVCHSSLGVLFAPLLWCSAGVLVVSVAVLSFLTRGVPSAYNEQTHIAFSCYIVLVCGVLAVLTGAVLENNSTAETVTRTFLLFMSATCVLAALFGTKLFQLAQMLRALRSDPVVQVAELRKRLKRKFLAAALAKGLTKSQAEQEAKVQLERHLADQQMATAAAGGAPSQKDSAIEFVSLLPPPEQILSAPYMQQAVMPPAGAPPPGHADSPLVPDGFAHDHANGALEQFPHAAAQLMAHGYAHPAQQQQQLQQQYMHPQYPLQPHHMQSQPPPLHLLYQRAVQHPGVAGATGAQQHLQHHPATPSDMANGGGGVGGGMQLHVEEGQLLEGDMGHPPMRRGLSAPMQRRGSGHHLLRPPDGVAGDDSGTSSPASPVTPVTGAELPLAVLASLSAAQFAQWQQNYRAMTPSAASGGGGTPSGSRGPSAVPTPLQHHLHPHLQQEHMGMPYRRSAHAHGHAQHYRNASGGALMLMPSLSSGLPPNGNKHSSSSQMSGGSSGANSGGNNSSAANGPLPAPPSVRGSMSRLDNSHSQPAAASPFALPPAAMDPACSPSSSSSSTAANAAQAVLSAIASTPRPSPPMSQSPVPLLPAAPLSSSPAPLSSSPAESSSLLRSARAAAAVRVAAASAPEESASGFFSVGHDNTSVSADGGGQDALPPLKPGQPAPFGPGSWANLPVTVAPTLNGGQQQQQQQQQQPTVRQQPLQPPLPLPLPPVARMDPLSLDGCRRNGSAGVAAGASSPHTPQNQQPPPPPQLSPTAADAVADVAAVKLHMSADAE